VRVGDQCDAAQRVLGDVLAHAIASLPVVDLRMLRGDTTAVPAV
jgi:hypothetical protein